MGELEITDDFLQRLEESTPKSLALKAELERQGKKDPPKGPEIDLNNLPIPGKDFPEPG